MVPELRAARLMEIAARIKDEYAGDLRSLAGPLTKVRQALKSFPHIADPGADRILLFGGIAPVPSVPSNCPHALVRILPGLERENDGVTYGEAKTAIEAAIPATFDARTRAYLLLKRHGQQLCKRDNPQCDRCLLSSSCAFFALKYR